MSALVRTHDSAILQARDVVRELGALRTPVLKGITLDVARAEFVALTGASGSGKSTLLYLLGALDRPTSGSVLLEGVDIGALDDDDRAVLRSEKYGFVFQFHFLLPELTVLENVTTPMRRRGSRSAREIVDRARATLDTLGLLPLSERYPGQLSGGQQQRVSIARAIANEPTVLLADEPTGNLDSANGRLVLETFMRLVDETKVTVVMVTHERSFAEMAHREVWLRDGEIEHETRRRPAA
jgi:lipoprotein-releasing system ATP-binding protein